jgi:hypothetical protein
MDAYWRVVQYMCSVVCGESSTHNCCVPQLGIENEYYFVSRGADPFRCLRVFGHQSYQVDQIFHICVICFGGNGGKGVYLNLVGKF